METINDKFSADFETLRDKIELLRKTFKEGVDDLPDDLNTPEFERDAHKVKWFSEMIYSLGCDISEIGEDMMVDKQVGENYEERYVEMNGHREFEGYGVGQ